MINSVAFGTFTGLAPTDGPKVVPTTLDFSVLAAYNIDMFMEESTAQIGFVQSVYIDNADNPNSLTIVCAVTNQRIRVRANTQGWYPILATDKFACRVSSTLGAYSVSLHFSNVPMPTAQWAA